jgi:hypothetical protein
MEVFHENLQIEDMVTLACGSGRNVISGNRVYQSGNAHAYYHTNTNSSPDCNPDRNACGDCDARTNYSCGTADDTSSGNIPHPVR